MECLKNIRSKPQQNTNKAVEDELETEEEYKERWVSIRVIYFTMFLMSLGFSIILTGVWPYLRRLDPMASKEFMGYVVGANPFGQMIFSPLFGWWSNRLGSIRIPLLFAVALFTVSSGIYSSLEFFGESRKYWMVWSRFLVGVSSANIAVCRSYLSAATRFKERTGAVSMVSLAQVLGFVIGPAVQALVVPLGDTGVDIIPGRLTLNMFTAAGWINVFMSIINFILFLPFVFKEHKIAAKEVMISQGKTSEKETWKNIKPDYFASWTLIVAFFILVFNFMLLETLGTSLTMDQFAWTKSEALYYMGILMSVGAVIACGTFFLIGPLCKILPERKVMLWGGFLFMVIGRAVYIPWGTGEHVIYEDRINNTKSIFENTTFNVESGLNVTELVGCPSSQVWCSYTPVMTLFQFIFGFIVTTMGYPIGVTLIQTIFSKILGPRPQGVWMGLMTGSGCLSRVMGPVFVSYIYTRYGTVWTFTMTTMMMVLCMLWLLVFNNRLIPIEENGNELNAKITMQSKNNLEDIELQEISQLVDNVPTNEISNQDFHSDTKR